MKIKVSENKAYIKLHSQGVQCQSLHHECSCNVFEHCLLVCVLWTFVHVIYSMSVLPYDSPALMTLYQLIEVRQDTPRDSVNCSFYYNLFVENIPATVHFAVRMVGGYCAHY